MRATSWEGMQGECYLLRREAKVTAGKGGKDYLLVRKAQGLPGGKGYLRLSLESYGDHLSNAVKVQIK